MKYSLVGYGVSNRALAKFLSQKGEEVFVSDVKPIEDKFKLENVEYEVGNSERILQADKIIVSPSISPEHPIVLKAKAIGIPVICDVELFYQMFKPKIVAITGTNGKSTTVALTNEILQKKYVSYIAGNFGIPVFDLANKDYDFLVMEISSFQLHWIDSFKPIISALINLTPDHINWHGSFEDYKKDKYRIFSNLTTNDTAIINSNLQLPESECKKLRFSLNDSESDYFVRNNAIFEGEDELFEVRTKLKGTHNVENIVAATAIARTLKICKENIAEAVYNFKPLEHRLETVDYIDGVEFVNDSKSTTTDSTIKAVNSFDKPILILGGRTKGEDYAAFLLHIKSKVSAIVLIGESSDEFKRYCMEFDIPYLRSNSMCDAVQSAFNCAKNTHSTVLLSPATASYDMFTNYKERGVAFKNCVRELKSSKSF
jgi:UDP-N-acetylmuramoylalanine--D-glutamate ligase